MPPSPAIVSTREYARFLVRYLRPRAHLVLFLAVTLLVNIGLQLYNPQIMRSFIDTALAGGALDLLTRMALLFIAIAFSQQLIGVLVVYITENLGWGATNDLRLDLARYCLGLDMSFHTAHTPGEMIERIDGDVMALSNFFSQFIIQVFANILLVVGILVVLALENWRIGLALGAFVGITIAVLTRLANIAVSSWEEERQSSANLYGFLEERLSGTEDIRSNNAVDYVLHRFYQLTRELMRKTIRAGLKVNILLNTTWVLFAIGNAVAILVSAWLFQTRMITIGTVYMIVYYTNMLNWPLDRITQQMQDLQKAGASLVRIINIQRTTSKIPGEDHFTPPEHGRLHPGPLAVSFEKVTFGYQDAPLQAAVAPPSKPAAATAAEAPRTAPRNEGAASLAFTLGIGERPPVAADVSTGDIVAAAFANAGYPRFWKERLETFTGQDDKEIVLRDVSFRLEPGRILGLLGRTGSGKTTLTRLLFHLYNTDGGLICLGDETGLVNLREVPVQELRRRIGMVTQNIQLFHATVRENLTFFNNEIPDARIHEAIADLGLSDWFNALPKGLDTELEAGGGGLSAGEAQLLAFTRIFLRDPGLVILDEATSRLDPATEHLIERAVDKLIRNRTAIIVAHRLGTVQRADDILILENGQVIEYGPRARLAGDPSTRFHQLLETGLEVVLA